MKSETLHPSSLILRTFFQKFDLFADAPDAVAKMRELVLELAVQGKLSEHRAADVKDPAWLKLAQQLDAEPNASTFDIEPPFEIPRWWRWTTLQRLGDTKPRNDAPDETKSSFVPMTLIPAEYGQSARHEERPWGEIKKGYTHFQNGDVVMAKITPCFENGKSAVMMGLTGGSGAGTTELHVFRRSGDGVLPEFVIIYLKTRGFITRGEPRMTGSAGQKRVPYDYFARSPFPLPPLAEQKRIVAKVDELMAICDRLEAQQQERESRHSGIARASLARFAEAPTTANLNFIFHKSYDIPPADLRKSILTLAVQGKLVPQDPNDEPAEMTCAGLKQLSGESSDHAGIPDQWALCSYRSLTTLVTSGSRGWKQFYAEKGSIFIRTQNINTDKLILDDVAFVDLPRSAEERRAQVLIDDILITITGANVTKAARVEKHIPEAYVSQHIALTRPRWSKMSEWLHLCFVSHGSARGILEKVAYGDKPGLNLNNIRDLMLPIPPLAEQRRIVAKVDELMALVDALETQLDTSRTTAAKLLSALVAELTNL
jgi:type I restriction enzyme, S subunit